MGTTPTNSCGATLTGTGSGSTSINVSNVGLAAGASCQVGINVTSSTIGTVNNQTSAVSSNEAGTGSASNTASLSVGGSGTLPPTISIGFSPSTIQVDFSTTLTFTINNPNGASSLSGIAFTDSLPSNLFVLSPNNGLTGSCGSGTIAAVAGSQSISLSGGTLAAAGSCVFSVNVTATATGTINDTTGNISSNEGGTGGTSNTVSLTVTAAGAIPTVAVGTPAGAPPQAGGATQTFTITVANDQAGDTPSVTSFTLNGAACTTATCGSFAAVQGTAGSGSYTVVYTPPAGPLAAAVSPVVTVTPSLSAPYFAGTLTFSVFPSGLVLTGTGNRVVQTGGAAQTLTYTVYNDVGNAGVNISLLASGFTCQSLSPNSCGTLGTPVKTTNGTTTTTTVTYTPPAAVPVQPYNRPQVLAIAAAETTQFHSTNIILSTSPQAAPLSIPFTAKLDSSLTGGSSITITAGGVDTGNTKTTTWALLANGVACTPPTCGTLGTPVTTTNGNIVSSTITYTPPSVVPTVSGQANPTITASFTDTPSATDSFSFNIVDGTCGTGNNAVLNGDYAFLVRGGGAGGGYVTLIGSFVANGSGTLTSGLLDINRTAGALTGLTMTGTYSVGSDNRGCLTWTRSDGNTQTFRFALGTISGSSATQGEMLGFNDDTGELNRVQGVLMQQTTSAFNPSSINGTYVFGREGVDVAGGRFSIAGLFTANGVNTLSNITADYDDAFTGATSLSTPGTGTFSLATNAAGGRGTSQTTITGTSGTVVSNYIAYVVSPSLLLTMSSDTADANHPIISGEAMLQTGTFSTTTLDNNGYVLYVSGVDNSNGGNNIGLGQANVTTNGAATLTLDQNDNGTESAEHIQSQPFSIGSTGRTTLSGGGGKNPIFYLVDSTQGFAVGTDNNGFSGYIQKQTGGPFSNTTVPANAFFGGSAANVGSGFDSGAVAFNTTAGTISGTDDSSTPSGSDCSQCNGNGLEPNNSISNGGGTAATYAFASVSNSSYTFAPTAAGQGVLGNGLLGYIVSPTKIVFMQIGATSGFGGLTPASAISNNPAELFIGQH